MPSTSPAGQRQFTSTPGCGRCAAATRRSAVVTARSVGPLGLAGRQSSHRVPWQVRILPPFLSRKHLPSRLAKLRELDGMLPVLIRGQGTEFDSLREYVIGDDVRSIDWRATARRADVVVRTWRPERDRRVVIVLDTGRTSAGRVGVDPTASDPGGWPRLDWSMDAALLLAALASRAGDHVDFLAHDRVTRAGVFNASRTELLAPAGRTRWRRCEPALVESDATAMVAAVQRRVRRRALVVLLTDLNASALDEGLMAVLPQLSAKHQVLLAAVADPRVERAGRRAAPTPAQVYDAAAAERARNDRRAIASRLRAPRRRRRRRAAGGTGPRAGRPLPGDEGHRPALGSRVSRVGTTSGASSMSPVSPAATRLAAEVDHVGQECRSRRAPRWRSARTSAAATASRSLDQPGHQQHDDQPDRHRDHGPALFGQHLAARPVAGRDHRPAQPHADRRRPGTPRSARAARAGRAGPEQMSPLPAANIRPPDDPEIGGVLEQHIRESACRAGPRSRCTARRPTSC